MGLKKSLVPAIVGMFSLVLFLGSCEEELDTLGDGVIGGEPFETNRAEFDVFAFNKNVVAVQTNRLPVYQVGTYNDPVYGRREAHITSQLRLPVNTNTGSIINTFGNLSQAQEDGAENDENPDTIDEEETITEVILYMPYQLIPSTNNDSDGDSVIDSEDLDPNDPNSDSDGDGVTDSEERNQGSDPLNADEDGSEEDFVPNTFPIAFELDSIYGSENALSQPFNFKVERSSFFLRDLDPEANFEEAQEYFSNTNIPSFVEGAPLFEGEVTISNEQFVIFEEDDPETETDESEVVDERLPPGIRVRLDPQFFQENLLDMEGSLELLSQANFANFLRGLHFSLQPANGDVMLLLDLSQATITLNYEFQDYIDTNISDDELGSVETIEREFVLNLLRNQNNTTFGNAVNTFIDDPFSAEVSDELDTGVNASRIYLKGGSGVYAELFLFDEDEDVAADIIDGIRANNWIINEAILSFYIDTEKLNGPEGFVEPPRLYLYDTETNLPLISTGTENSVSQLPLGQFLNYDGIIQTDEDGDGIKYSIRITEHINDLILRDAPNEKLALTLTANIGIFAVLDAMGDSGNVEELPVLSNVIPSGTVLFGNNVAPENEDKKLKLEIFFTEID